LDEAVRSHYATKEEFSMHRPAERRVTYLWLTIALALIAGLAITLTASQSQAKTRTRSATAGRPTVVLVNGAWANSAAWSGVIERLQTEGYTVDAPPNPLQSLKGDAGAIADLLKTIKGPIVLVGHSYGGAVITNAATGNRNVKALVYVDAFAPAKGDTVLELDLSKPGSALGAGPTKVFNFVPFPGAKKGDAELYVKPSVFEQAFANGLPAKQAAVLAATQGPVVYSAVTAPSGTPAWKTIPSWYVLGTIDKAIPPAIQLFMAQRIHAHITRVRAGHLSMVSAPGVVAKVITAAAKATS
jgi:pimeloyl-ACP methyl ester carboxylesterase